MLQPLRGKNSIPIYITVRNDIKISKQKIYKQKNFKKYTKILKQLSLD